MVVIGFELRLGNRAGTMNLCVPFNVIEPFMERLSSQTWFAAAKQQAAPDVERQISQTLSAAPVEISGTLEMTTITIQELLQLAVGDVITTEHPVSRPILVHVEGERKYTGQLGQYRHCHGSVYLPYKRAGGGDLIKGFEILNSRPYSEVKSLVQHPVACIDCHDPATMQLRVTRPGFIEGIQALKAS